MPNTKNPSSMERASSTQKVALLALCAGVLWCGGCFTQRPVARRPVPIAFAHPIIPAALPIAPLENAPDIALEIVPPPRLATAHNSPPRPRVAPSAPAEPTLVEKPADPIIVPDMSSQELNVAKAETQHSLEIAEWNLAQTQGKQLNTAQQDVASKIRGFVETSRDAMKKSDWQRARNLAKKAEVLSHELVANL
jgi:hypothetical protein